MSDKTMDRIQALLNQANDVGATDDERRIFQAKADELMHKHKIDKIMLRMRSGAKAEELEHKPIYEEVPWVSSHDEFRDVHTHIAAVLAKLAEVRILFGYDSLHIVGYPQDIQYFRMLWVSAHLAFSGKLFPEWEKKLTDGQNIRALAESGIKWLAIWEKARQAGVPMMRTRRGTTESEEVPAPPDDNGWMKRQMAAAYAADGLEKPQLRHGVQRYRDSFAVGFQVAVEQKCWAMISVRRQREREAGSGVDLVLASDATAVDDLFRKLFPPSTLGMVKNTRRLQRGYGLAADRGAAAGRSVDMSPGNGMGGGAPSPGISSPRPAIGG